MKKISTIYLIFSICLLVLFSLNFTNLHAEGTKEIRPSSGNAGYLVLDNAWSDFALYDCDATSRLHIRVCNVGEIIYYGFRQTSNDVKYRLRDPDGNIVVNETTLPSSGAGRIGSHSEAVAGPEQIVGGSGYEALSHTATKTGDYYIEFKNPGSRRTFSYFDITVATAGNVAIPGRVWSQAWMFSTDSYTNTFKGKLYIYSDDGIVTSLDFNSMQPYVFVVSANATGTDSTGNFTEDRKSRSGLSTYPQYKIFLNNPDENCFPTGAFGQVTDVEISGCGPNKCINITSTSAGNILLLLDLNGTAGYQAGTADRQFAAAVINGVTCIPWNTEDGLGNEVPGGTNIPMQIDYLNGITHLPLYDVEYHTNGYEVELIRPADPDVPKLYWDDTNLPGGTTELTGCNSPCHTWSWGGSDSKANDYGNRNTVNTWWYAKVDVTTITLPVSTAIVDADRNNPAGEANDTTICANQNTLQLAGSVTGFTTTGEWSTTTGGTFSDDESMDAVYTFTAAEKVAGNIIKLVLTSTNNGTCPAVRDTLTINFAPAPTASVGPADPMCKNNPTIELDGVISVATGGQWIGGNGTFVPNRTTLDATYTPTQAELDADGVTLTLETTGNGICPFSSDAQVFISYEESPVADAGDPQTKCANNAIVTLEGEVENETSFAWVGGAGTFTPNRTTLNVTYTPTQAEINSGSVVLNLTASRAGCHDVTDPVTITFTPAPTIDAGLDQTVCKNDTIVNLDGSFTLATDVAWTGGLGTFTPDRNDPKAEYQPHPSELGGNVTLTLTTTAGLGNCSPVDSDMILSFINAPVVTAGDDEAVCANNAQVTLNGTSTTGSGTWVGGGIFVPGPNTLTNVTYTPSDAEKAVGIAQLFLRSTNNGICNTVEDTLLIVVTPAQTVDAGTPKTVCANNPSVVLTGSSSVATASWSGGSGTFSSVNSPTATYTPHPDEISAGSVELTLTATKNPPPCANVSDKVLITITSPPTISAGSDRIACANNPNVALNGSVTIAGGAEWIGGTGTFTPDRNTLTATYTPTAAEIDNGNGSVTLTLSSTDNGACSTVTEDMTISFTASPTVEAGNPQSVCANNPAVTLSDASSSTASGTWTGGTGSFAPNRNTINATYTPAAGETSVNLTLTTEDNGNCNSVSDQMTITITDAPTVNPGNPVSVCADAPEVTLNGSVTVATDGVWTGGNGTFSPDRNTLGASYTPSSTEVTNGSVTLTLTSVNNSNCNAVSEEVTLTITPAPTVDAGSDQTVCGAVTSVNLEGKVTVATGGTWATLGSGTFADANSLITTYTPSQADRDNGVVTLTLTTTGSGQCIEVSEPVKIFFTSVPSIFAGPDQEVCTNEFPIQLAATGSPATWSGFGGAISDANDLNATYTPSAGEIGAGTVTLTVTTIASGACPSISEDVIITILAQPVPNAGGNQTVCGNATSIALTGTEPEFGTGFWTTTGAGSFSPNAATLNASYVPTAAERTNGASITNTLISTPNVPCPSEEATMDLTIAPEITAFAGPDQIFCADVTTIDLNGSVETATGGTWSIIVGAGTIDDVNSLSTTYNVDPGDYATGVTLRLTSAATANCAAVTSDVSFTFTPAATADAGLPLTMCSDDASINLTGIVGAASTGGLWTTDGTGSFSPDAATLNTTYFPSASDTALGTVNFTLTTTGNGTCIAAEDNVVLTINPKPLVEAGSAISVCKDVTDINLSGFVDNSTGQLWTTFGTGTFNDATLLNATYTPSNQDKNGGTVTLKLTSTGIGTCNDVEDLLLITFTDTPTANAGPDLTVCADVAGVPLNASITVASGGTWSSTGSGSFSPDVNTLNATYIPSDLDTTAGTVTLTLKTTGNGNCLGTYESDMILTIDPKPIVSAGDDQTICADSAYVVLNGAVVNALGGEWTTSGSGNFFPNKNTLNANYVPSVADKNSGTVTLTLASTGHGSCNAVTEDMIITITPGPSANAGINQEICASTNTVNLSGTVNIVSTGKWTTSGTGTFSDATNLNATYTPSQNDKNSGGVVLTLATTNNGNCKAATGQMNLVITPIPVADPGANKSICADASEVQLNGKVTNATGGAWTTSGTGVFGPDTNTLTAKYFPSTADKLASPITLTLTTTGNGVCDAVSQSMTITITPAPTVDAGEADTICADANSVALSGSKSIASGGLWSSNGTGTFSPDATTLNASYLPSATDKNNGTVTLTLTTTGNGTCNAVSEDVAIIITPAPTADAGDDQTVCVDYEFITLDGSVTNASGGIWSTSGTGEFIPDENALNAQYFPSQEDKDDGSITLTLTTTGMGTCNAVSNNMTITFDPEPTVAAGPDISVCNLVNDISLNPTLTIATQGVWETTGTGTFDNEEALNAIYTPSAADKAGSVILILSTTDNGACDSKKDSVIVTFTASPAVSAGNPKTVCETDPVVLEASGTTGTWSGGSNNFTPNANTLNATYIPAPAEIGGAPVILTFTPTPIPGCPLPSDDVAITITAGGPSVDAGAPLQACANTTGIPLAGTFSGATGIKWSTGSGTGTFSSDIDENATFTPSPQQIAAGVANLTLTTTGNNGCNAQSDKVAITITPSPTVSAGSNQNICATATTVNLAATKTVATGVSWSLVPGSASGSFSPNNLSDSPVYNIVNADSLRGFVILRVTTTGNGTNCESVESDITITFAGQPTSDAGADTDHCADVTSITLAGNVDGAAGGEWSSTGDGTFSPSVFDLNATYIPSADDKTGFVDLTLSTTGNGACIAGTSVRRLTFTPPPTVAAGDNLEFCSDEVSVALTGTTTNANPGGGILWTTSGTGSFSSDTDPLASYFPSAQDKINGGANLTITTTNSAPCAEIEDYVTLTILPAPTSSVNAGQDQELCRDVTSVDISGTITIAGGGKWSTLGNGTFFPNDSTLDAEYIPSNDDKNNGSVELVLTSTGNGICTAAADTMKIEFTPSTIAVAGASDPAICADVTSLALNGSVTHATGGEWSTSGSGTFSPNKFTKIATYFPSQADFDNGSVGFTLTTTGNGTCNASSGDTIVRFTKKPVVTAGSDKVVCSDVVSIPVSASLTNATGGTWTTSGTGTFGNANLRNTIYTPSADDKASTRVNLTFTATLGIGTCNPVSSEMTVDFTPAPTVEAGPPQTICADLAGLSVTGTVTVATGGLWTTSGSGVFAPNANSLTATYSPSEDDKGNGPITLTLTTTGNGTCNPVSDTKVITIVPKPIVDAGPAVSCADLDGALLNGVVNHAGGGLWSTSNGTGTFAVSPATLGATYFPSDDDMTAGSVSLTLTSTSNGTCIPVSETTTLLVTPLPVADAGNDQYVCTGSPITLLAQTEDGVRYAWSDDAPAAIGTGESVTLNVPADMYVVLAATDGKGCVTRDTVRLNVYDLPTLTLDPNSCLSDSLVLDAQPTNMPVVPGQFQWFKDGKILQGENDYTLAVKNIGIHTIRWSYNSCSEEVSTTVHEPPFLLSVDTIVACDGGDATLTTVSTPATGLDFVWTTGGLPAGSTQTIIATPVLAGISTYLVEATDVNGCLAKDSIKINGIPTPVLNLSDSISCQGEVIELDGGVKNIPGYLLMEPVWQWKKDNVLLTETDSLLSINSTGQFVALATIDQCTGSDTADILLNPLPIDGLTSETKNCFDDLNPITLDAVTSGLVSYIWIDKFGDTISTTQTASLDSSQIKPQAYVKLVTVNNLNCTREDSVLVRDLCQPRMFPPNAFTPNGEGPNELFFVASRYVTNYKLTIFNRWGEIIFYSEDPAEGWDGNYRGAPMPVGVYPFIITYEGEDEEFKGPHEKVGSVTLIR